MTDEQVPLTLAELFARDPRELTDLDIDRAVADLRTKRSQFNMGAANSGRVKATAKQIATEELTKKAGLSILDLLATK